MGVTPFRLLRLGCMIRDEDGYFECISKRDKVKAWGELILLINAVYAHETMNNDSVFHDRETREEIHLKTRKELHVATRVSDLLPKEIFLLFVKYFSHQLSEPDEYRRLPLHIAAESSSPAIMSLLLQRNSAAAKVADFRGRYPLTLIIQRGLCWNDITQDLFDTFPNAVSKFDRCSRMYPFMLASAVFRNGEGISSTTDSTKSMGRDVEQEERNRVDCSYRMLLQYPSAICNPCSCSNVHDRGERRI